MARDERFQFFLEVWIKNSKTKLGPFNSKIEAIENLQTLRNCLAKNKNKERSKYSPLSFATIREFRLVPSGVSRRLSSSFKYIRGEKI